MKKKIILIGGTSYSGSTMLDMILGNDPNGFSAGEYRGFLMPRKMRHYNTTFISKEAENLWSLVKRNSLKNIYKTIFSEYRNVKFIVDSSKHPLWIKQMETIAIKQGFDVKHVLLWKTPEEFAYSCYKRKKLKNWDNSWKKYYRLYFSIFNNFTIVSYSKLVKDEAYLKEICYLLDIPYFNSKREFWQKKSFTLGGNRSAKMHLYNKDSEAFRKSAGSLIEDSIDRDLNIQKKYQQIYYELDDPFLIDNHIKESINSDFLIKKIQNVLKNNMNIIRRSQIDKELLYKKSIIRLFFLYKTLKIYQQMFQVRILRFFFK